MGKQSPLADDEYTTTAPRKVPKLTQAFKAKRAKAKTELRTAYDLVKNAYKPK